MNGFFVFAGVLAFIGAGAIIWGVVCFFVMVLDRGHRLNWLETKAKHLDDRLDRCSEHYYKLYERVNDLEEANVKTKPRK
jgi:hypothetical protein